MALWSRQSATIGALVQWETDKKEACGDEVKSIFDQTNRVADKQFFCTTGSGLVMPPRWSSGVVDRFIAPSISEFDVCDAPDLTAEHPEAKHWLANHFLNSVFRRQFEGKYRQYAINLLFRAQATFDRYHEGRQMSAQYLDTGSPSNPALSLYFRAISAWESAFLNLQLFTDILNKMHKEIGDPPAFCDGDGSVEQRAYAIANRIKHWGGDLSSGRFSDGDTVPLWMSNVGFHTRDQQLTFSELGQLVLDIAAIAKDLQDPASFLSKSSTGSEP